MSDKKIPPKPEKPDPYECCGGGCVPCIYDFYYAQLDKWEELYGTGKSSSQAPTADQAEETPK